MSKTQQVKQYKKQIEQLNNEVTTYKVTAEAHNYVPGIVTHIHTHTHAHTHTHSHTHTYIYRVTLS